MALENSHKNHQAHHHHAHHGRRRSQNFNAILQPHTAQPVEEHVHTQPLHLSPDMAQASAVTPAHNNSAAPHIDLDPNILRQEIDQAMHETSPSMARSGPIQRFVGGPLASTHFSTPEGDVKIAGGVVRMNPDTIRSDHSATILGAVAQDQVTDNVALTAVAGVNHNGPNVYAGVQIGFGGRKPGIGLGLKNSFKPSL